jgi:RND family efflux transporter MFP subunit
MNKKRIVQLGVALTAAVVILAAFFVVNSDKKAASGNLPVTLNQSSVEMVKVERKDEKASIVTEGTVESHQELVLLSEVSGKIIERSNNLDVGGIVKKDEVLIKVDPRNYISKVEEEKANVEKAKFELQTEKGKQLVAEREWKLLNPDSEIKTTDLGKELALRVPHIRQKEAALRAAISKLEKARQDLERTVIKAPFDAIVKEESVEVGQSLSDKSPIAKLIATNEFRIQISIPYDAISWLKFSKNGEKKGTEVLIRQKLMSGQVIERKGFVLRLLGVLDPNTNSAKVLVVVYDPLQLQCAQCTMPLLIGSEVTVIVEGPVLKGVFAIPAKALKDGNIVWVKGPKKKLESRKVTVVSKNNDTVLVSEGLNDGDEVIVQAR